MAAAPWQGDDADTARRHWARTQSRQLDDATRALDAAAGTLLGNADEQERASTGSQGGRVRPLTAGVSAGAAAGPGLAENLAEQLDTGGGSDTDFTLKLAGVYEQELTEGERTWTPETSVDGPGGLFGVSAGSHVSVVEDTETVDGVATYTLRYNHSTSVSGSVDVGRVAAGLGSTEGSSFEFTVHMPSGVADEIDPTRVDPFQPDTIPPGARVVIDEEDYERQTSSATLNYLFHYEDEQGPSQGRSLAVERLDNGHLRVTRGPTNGMMMGGELGLGTDAFRAVLGQQTSLEFGDYTTVEFDLRTEAGAGAYQQFLATGDFRQHGPGVSGYAVVETFQHSSQTTYGVETPVFDASTTRTGMHGNDVLVTYADGSQERIQHLQYGTGQQLVYTGGTDADGNTVDGGTYRLTFEADGGSMSVWNRLLIGPDSSDIQQGDTVTYSITPDQIRDLIDASDSHQIPSEGMDPDDYIAYLVEAQTTNDILARLTQTDLGTNTIHFGQVSVNGELVLSTVEPSSDPAVTPGDGARAQGYV